MSKVKDEFLKEAKEEVLDGLDENETEEVQFSSAQFEADQSLTRRN